MSDLFRRFWNWFWPPQPKPVPPPPVIAGPWVRLADRLDPGESVSVSFAIDPVTGAIQQFGPITKGLEER